MILYVLPLMVALASGETSPGATLDSLNSPCPSQGSEYLDYVKLFFASEETRPVREQFGLAGISPEEVRVLMDEQDAEVCRRMSQSVTVAQNGPYPKVWRGYQAGTFYIMLITRETPPGVFYHGGGTGMIFLDQDLRIIAAVS